VAGREARSQGPDFELQEEQTSLRGDEVDVLIGALGLYIAVTVPQVGVLAVSRGPVNRRDWNDDQVLLGRPDDPDLPE